MHTDDLSDVPLKRALQGKRRDRSGAYKGECGVCGVECEPEEGADEGGVSGQSPGTKGIYFHLQSESS